MSTSQPGNLPPQDGSSPRRRRRRHTPARRFTGVGRHGSADRAAVEEALARLGEEQLPEPLPVAPAIDEFDEHPESELISWEHFDDAEPVDGAVGEHPYDGAWLAHAEEEADAVPHHGSGFGDALARFGGAPAGYLPAEDVFGSEPVDLSDRKRRRRKRGLILTTIVLVFLLAVGGGGYWVLKQLTAPPADFAGAGTSSVSFTVESGWGAKQIGRHLLDAGIIKSTGAFDNAVDAAPQAAFHPGTFELKKEMSAAAALAALTTTGQDAVSYFALQPNERLPKALEVIAEGTGLDIGKLTKLSKDPSAFGLPSSASNLEGWLFPGEYRFPIKADAKTVLQGLVDASKDALVKAGVTDPAKQQRTLTLASIVMAEGMKSDYSKIAGVIENRLAPGNTETHGLLQSDATVIYGLNRYSLLVSKEEQADAGNPYNTYKHKGLPPTPIGSPNAAAIAAAANPSASDDYYWVTVNLDTGETLFARTHAEHLANVQKYREWCQQNEGRCK